MSLQPKRWLFVLAAASLGFVMWGTLLSVAPYLNLIGKDLQLSFSQEGLVFSFPLLALALFAVPGGILVDRFGPRKMGAIGGILIGAGGLLRSTSTNLEWLILFSTIFGAGWGLSLPALPKLIGGWFSGRAAGTMTGLYTLGIYVGAGVATAMTFTSSWRNNLSLWGGLALAVCPLWWVLVRDPPRTAAGSSSGIRAILHRRNIWFLTALFFLGANVTFYTLTGWLPTILAATTDPASAALVSSLLSFAAAAATIAIPFTSDRSGRRKIFLWLPALVGVGASYLLFNFAIFLQTVAVLLLGVAISSIFVISLILSIELFPRELVGSASGIMLMGYFGGLVGPWLAGTARDFTSSFAPMMLMLIVSFAATIVLALFLPETGNAISRGNVHSNSSQF